MASLIQNATRNLSKTLQRSRLTCTQRATFAASAESSSPKTGIVMLNMGGPADPKDTGPFLSNLFNDPEIITLGGGTFQKVVANLIVNRRTPKVEKQYEEIGGSPILKWTELQGQGMCDILNSKCAETGPYKAYTMFRYVTPYTEETLLEMKKDGIEHAIAFSQYPQWCCNTTGSSMNHLWRELERLDMKNTFKWSIIDRWHSHPGYIEALVDRIEYSLLNQFSATQRQNEDIMILFSAHSLPMKSVTKGDPYVFEVSATVKQVMARLFDRISNKEISIDGLSASNIPRHQLTWQSKVGFLPWMTPSTEEVLKSVGKTGRYKNVLVVPFVFTSDHVETLFELDIEYAETAKEVGISHYVRCPALNDSAVFINALADIVDEHMQQGLNYSSQYKLRCHNCVNEGCRSIVNPKFDKQEKTANVDTINMETQAQAQAQAK